MKKSMKKTIISIVLIVALLVAGGLLAGKALLGNKVNVSWYSDDETEFVIKTADQLYELVEISEKMRALHPIYAPDVVGNST